MVTSQLLRIVFGDGDGGGGDGHFRCSQVQCSQLGYFCQPPPNNHMLAGQIKAEDKRGKR